MSKFRKILCLGFAILVCCSTAQPVNAATRLGPEHLYMWAKRGDLTRLHQYQRYINLQDKNHNTALCIAQQHQDKNAYALLLKFGASTKVSCHDDDDPICAVVAGEKTKISPAAWWLLGAGAAAGAYALLNNDGGHKHAKCPVGYEKDLKDCSKETHPEGWNYYRSGEADGHVCGKCEPKTCAIGYSTDYPSVDRCGTTGANGWRWKQDPVTPYAGNDICGNCTPKQCTEYAGGDGAEDIAHCRTFPTLDVAIDTNVVGYAGDTPCYKCTYTCKDEYYSSEATCKEGGYKCVSTTENNVTCWRQTGPAGCPDPSYTQGLVNCNAKAHPEGYTYTSSGQSGGEICGKCIPKTCVSPYTTSAQSVDGCGTTGANGYSWAQDTSTPYAGDLKCSKCTPYQCSRYDSGKGVANVDQCIVYEHLVAAIDTNVIGYAGETPCYKCTYTCRDEYYARESDCRDGGYTCSSATENNITCWWHTGSEECPSTYPEKGSCPAVKTGYTLVSSSSTKVGENTCYKCNYACDTANGWEQRTSCWVGKTCISQDLPYGAGTCYKPTGCSTDYPYTSKAACEEGGYICTESYAGSGCWKRGDPAGCPDPSYTPGLANCNGKSHPEGYTYTSSGQSGGEICGKCTPKTCISPYTTSAQSVDQCGTKGANGYAWSQDTVTPYAGDLKCSKCTPYQCSRYDSGKGVADVDQCTTYSTLDVAIDTNVIGYAGETPCYKCTYTCKDEYYTREEDCKEGGYTCTSSTQNNVTCWRHTGSEECPSTYPERNSCPASETGYTLTSSSSIVVGGNLCYKCNYACDTANGWEKRTSCWVGKTCQTKALPYGEGTCYKPTGCSTDYPYTTKAACEQGGYTCTESYAGSGCWKRDGASSCPDPTYTPGLENCNDKTHPEGYTYTSSGQSGGQVCGKCTPKTCSSDYDTKYQSVANCGTTGANGYSWTQDSGTPYAGDLKCGKCTPYQCSRYDDGKGVANVNQCMVYSMLDAAIDTNVIGYAGETPCYKCTYTCKDEYYTRESDCEEGGYTCSSNTQNSVTCWWHNGSEECPTTYPEKGSCPAVKTGYTLTSSSSTTVGDNTCYKCNYACDTANGWEKRSACWVGKTCQTQTLPYGAGTCYKATGCSTDYPYTTKAACEEGGYTCTESYTGSGCWKRGDPSGCPDSSYTPGLANCNAKEHPNGYTYTSSGQSGGQICGKCIPKTCNNTYSTQYQSVQNCGTTGANGYTWTQDTGIPYAGDLKCGKCTPYQCSRYDDGKGVSQVSQCDTYSTLDVAIDTNVIGYAGETPCYKCTYTCKDEYYTRESDCEEGGYTCTSSTQNGIQCWWHNGSEQCPTTYPEKNSCPTAKTGYTLTSSSSTTVGDDTCYKCNYACDTANGWEERSACWVGKVCTTQALPYGAGTCYKATGCSTDYPYTTKAACEEGGYTCTESYTGSGCWKRTGSDDCPSTYPEKDSCPTAKTGYTLTSSSSTKVGENTCYKCNYACDTANGWEQRSACWVGKTCISQVLPYSAGTCYKATGCSTDYPYTTKASCEEGGYTCTESYAGSGCWKRGNPSGCPDSSYTPGLANCNAMQHPNGYTYTSSGQSGGQVCGKCTPKTCVSPYTTSAQSVDQCGTKGANGYSWTQDTGTPYAGDLMCSRCTPYQCSRYDDGKGVANVNQCTTYSTLDVAIDTNVIGYAGETPCYKCTYTCKDEYYTRESDCEEGGYTCTSSTQNGVQCWWHTGSEECPTTYPEKGSCPAVKTGYTLTSSSSTTVGDNTCYKCNYACDTANGWEQRTSCWVGKTCQTQALPYGGTCYKATGCSTDYPYTSKASCETGGYTCTESYSGSGCWKRGNPSGCPDSSYTPGLANCNAMQHPNGYTYTSSGQSGGQVCGKCTPKTCVSPYTTSAQSVDQCGTKGANGYSWTQDTGTPYAGDLMCSRCTPYQCSRYDDGKGVSQVSQCTTYSTLDVAIDTNVIGYAGETPCYKCTYTCKDEYYTRESDCEEGGYTCTSSTQNGVQCWWHTGSEECPTTYPEKGSCPTVKTGYTLTSSSSTTVGDNTCYKCNYACDTANGWEQRTSCWVGKTCQTQALPYGGTCYKATGCSTDYPYTSKASCETGGYTCTESYSGSGCWKRGEASACPDPSYTPGLANCNGKTHPEGYTYTSSGQSGGQVCGKCTPKTCNTGYTTSAQSIDNCGTKGANGYTWTQDTTTPYAGDLKCSKCTPYQCTHYDSGKGVSQVSQCTTYSTLDVAIDTNVIGYAGETPCYKCTYTCKDEYYTRESDCEEGGYTCTSSTQNGVQCWWHTGSEDCPTTYPEKGSCPTVKTGYTLTSSSSTTVGDNTCYKCNYACDTANGWEQRTSCWVGKTCQTQALPYGGTCYKATGCSTDYPYTSKASCETGGYTCTESYSGSGCWKRSGSEDCPTDYPEKSSCPTAQTGYTLTSSSSTKVGDNTCYKCNYACDTTNGWEQRTSCWVGKTCQTKALPYGAGTCYKATGCSTDYPYTSKASCETGGYTCTESYSGSGCWKRSGSADCPNDYPEKGSCPAVKTGYTLVSSSSTTVGENTCYKCNYACDTANGWEQRTSCWAGKTCQTQALPYGGTCYKATGCSTDYPYTSQTACEEGGYTCTESYSGSGCWKRGDASGCAPGYDTQYQSVDNCGTKGANGYTYTSSGTSGGLKCGKCTPKQCSDYAGGDGAADTSQCKTYSSLDVAIDTNVVGYAGEIPCYKCTYTCKDDYYDTEQDCLNDDNDHCSSVTEHGIPCWYPSNDGASLNSNMTMINTTERNITSSGNEDVYGLKGASNIENAVDEVTGEAGIINITHNSTGSAYGLYGESAGLVANRSGASINIANNTDGTAVGMHTSLGGTAINEGTITITGNLNTGTAIGIYGEGANRIINAENAIINVTSGNAYGIYLKDGNNSEITNAGTIYANGDNAHGIYVDENAHNATIINTGSIYLNGTNAGDAGITLNGGTLRNMSLMSFNGAANLNDLNGLIYLEDGGVYQAESLEGDLNVGTSNVLGGNQDTYVNEGALQADNIDNLNLASESAMFTARATANANGNGNDVVLERKDFAEFTPNESIANYLEDNYRAGNMEEMYDEIKSQRSQPNVNLAIAKDLGYDIFPNFADENYLTLKSLNRNITDTVLTPTDEVNRVVAGTDYINLETDNKGFLSGYDLDATSMYTFGDKRLDNQNRLGLGLSITRLTSDYDRGGDRKLTIFNLFVPYMHKFTDNLRLASILSAGYGNGEYDRENNHESDITDIFYGWTNELRYTMDLNGFAELEPALMLNALGYTEDGFDEGHGVGAIESKKTHNMSVEGGVGLFLKKKVSLEKYGRLGFKIGGAYYREMADPYDDIEARNRGAHGWYKINDYANIYDRDRALLEAAVDYEYKNIGLYAKYNQLIQRNDPKLIDLGLKVNF